MTHRDSLPPQKCPRFSHTKTQSIILRPNRLTRRTIFFWKLAVTCTPGPIRPKRRGPDTNRPTRKAIFFKLAVTCTPGPIWPKRRGPDTNRPTRRAIFFWKLAITYTLNPVRPTRRGPDPNVPTRRAISRQNYIHAATQRATRHQEQEAQLSQRGRAAVFVVETLKRSWGVTQDHWKWYHSKAWVRFPIRIP